MMPQTNYKEDLPCPQKENIRLYPWQQVIEAMSVMLHHEQYELPMYYGQNRVVIIRFKDLTEFLTHEKHGHNLLIHKLNFTVKSAVTALVEIRKHYS